MGFSEKVYLLAKKVPRGRVTTYREIARKLETRAYRAVGNALRRNKNPITIPCHRVVKSSGEVGGYCGAASSRKKIKLLEKEGIRIKNNRIIGFGRLLFRFR